MSASATRKRRYRARQRSGRIILRIEARSYELTLALLEADRVTEEQSRDRQQIEAAASAVLDRWVKYWMAHITGR